MPAFTRSPRYAIPFLATSWLLLCIVATVFPALPEITELVDDNLARLSVIPLISVIVVNWNGRPTWMAASAHSSPSAIHASRSSWLTMARPTARSSMYTRNSLPSESFLRPPTWASSGVTTSP
jgi:hypothetical protein